MAKPTDFNDLAQLAGSAAVKATVDKVLAAAAAGQPMQTPAPEWPDPILPGMVASVEIKTGQKTVLDYLIKPLNKVKEALRER